MKKNKFASVLLVCLIMLASASTEMKANDCSTPLALESNAQNDDINPANIRKVMKEKFPNREDFENTELNNLIEVLKYFGVRTDSDFANFITENSKAALDAERTICKELIEGFNAGESSPASTSGFSADRSEIETIKKGVYFTPSGLIREMMVSKFGEEYDDIIRGEMTDNDNAEYDNAE